MLLTIFTINKWKNDTPSSLGAHPPGCELHSTFASLKEHIFISAFFSLHQVKLYLSNK